MLEIQRSHVRTLPRALSAWVLPDRVELGTFSKAAGPWSVDWARARRDAITALDAIDFSQDEIVVWVPGTDATSVHHDFRQAMDYVYPNGHRGVSLSFMPYEASWDLRSSLPTGLATMKLLLEGIRQRLEAMPPAKRPKVKLAGLSQGAWIIGEALADRRAGAIVDRAVLAGHPWLAKTQYLDGHDPRVRVINHRGDQIAMPVRGDIGVGMDAMSAVKTGALGANLGKVAQAIFANPIHGVLLLQGFAREVAWMRPFLRDPHVYGMEMPRLARFLKDGVFDVTDEEIDDAKRHRPPSSFTA